MLTLLHSEREKLYGVLAILSAVGLKDHLSIAASFMSALKQIVMQMNLY